MKRFVVFIISLLLIFSFCIPLSSCSKESEKQLTEIASGLLEKSCEINEIFFGKGIETDEKSAEYAKEQLLQDSDIKIAAYAEVHADYKYQSTEDLKAAALEVYTEGYLEPVFNIAFLGHKDSQNGAIVEYARFVDNEFGLLTQRIDIEDEIIYKGRTFDASSIKIIKIRPSYVLFTVTSIVDGNTSDTMRIKMQKDTNGNWKLDTPTY